MNASCNAQWCGSNISKTQEGDVALAQPVQSAALTSLICLNTLSDIGTEVRAKPRIVLRNTLINPHDSFFLFLIIPPGPDAEISVHWKCMLRHLRVASGTDPTIAKICSRLHHLRLPVGKRTARFSPSENVQLKLPTRELSLGSV